MRIPGRALWWAAGGVIALALGVALLRPARVAVEIARVSRGPLLVTVDEDGETRVRDRFTLVAPVAGRVQRIAAQPGDVVRHRDVVVRMTAAPLDPRSRAQAEARLAAAQDAHAAAAAEVRQAREALAQARRDSSRAGQLARDGLIAPEAREQAELAVALRGRDLEAAGARAEAALHDAEAARAALESGGAGGTVVAIRAPVDGRVLRVPERSERIVAAGTPLIEVGDPRRLEVVVDLLSADAVRVRPGARVILTGWGGDSALAARVRLVEPAGFLRVSALGVEEQRVNLIADLPDPPAALGDGYRVEARVVLWEGSDVLQIPNTALFRDGDGWAVFAVADGRARRQAVTIGHRGEFASEVVAGLSPGDAVIRHPGELVRDGVRVSPR